MMHEREKSDPVIGAGKPTNNAGLPAAEPVEPRAGTKGNTARTGHSVGSACHRRSIAYDRPQG